MKPRADVVGLVIGLICLLLAALGLWDALGEVNWATVGLAAPFCLVGVGVVGLLASRRRPDHP